MRVPFSKIFSQPGLHLSAMSDWPPQSQPQPPPNWQPPPQHDGGGGGAWPPQYPPQPGWEQAYQQDSRYDFNVLSLTTYRPHWSNYMRECVVEGEIIIIWTEIS